MLVGSSRDITTLRYGVAIVTPELKKNLIL